MGRHRRLNTASLLIYEKTNTYTELLQSSSVRTRMTQAQSSGPQEDIISFDPLKSQKQEQDVRVPLPRPLSSTLQEDGPTDPTV